jgi:hypothetical protein
MCAYTYLFLGSVYRTLIARAECTPSHNHVKDRENREMRKSEKREESRDKRKTRVKREETRERQE